MFWSFRQYFVNSEQKNVLHLLECYWQEIKKLGLDFTYVLFSALNLLYWKISFFSSLPHIYAIRSLLKVCASSVPSTAPTDRWIYVPQDVPFYIVHETSFFLNPVCFFFHSSGGFLLFFLLPFFRLASISKKIQNEWYYIVVTAATSIVVGL